MMPFTGTVPEYLEALAHHNQACGVCCPGGGIPNQNSGPLCDNGTRIRHGLAYARGRAAGRTGAYL